MRSSSPSVQSVPVGLSAMPRSGCRVGTNPARLVSSIEHARVGRIEDQPISDKHTADCSPTMLGPRECRCLHDRPPHEKQNQSRGSPTAGQGRPRTQDVRRGEAESARDRDEYRASSCVGCHPLIMGSHRAKNEPAIAVLHSKIVSAAATLPVIWRLGADHLTSPEDFAVCPLKRRILRRNSPLLKPLARLGRKPVVRISSSAASS